VSDLLRRRFLQVAIGSAVGPGMPQHRQPAQMPASPSLAQFVDALPIPPVLRPSEEITAVTMQEIHPKLHRDLPPTRVWGYNGRFVGPTIEVRRGTPSAIRWESRLPRTHFLPVDHTLHGAHASAPEVRNVVHVHGMKVAPHSDGYPEAWFTADFEQRGPAWTTKVYRYPNDQPASTLWYHDHAVGITRLNMYAGLAGFYLIRDDRERSLNLPQGAYEIPLMLQDRLFHADGSLLYPVDRAGAHEVWIPEFFGDTVLVNGKAWPYLEVEPRKYRFRLLNASNARFYSLRLLQSPTAKSASNDPAVPAFRHIGADGGLLPFAIEAYQLVISPGERHDIVIDFAGQEGRFITLANDAAVSDSDDNQPVLDVEATPLRMGIMQFRVTRELTGPDTSASGPLLAPENAFPSTRIARVRNLEISEVIRPDGAIVVGVLGGLRFHDPVTETPRANTVELWNLINTTGDPHPIHVHLADLQVVKRQRFDTKAWASGHSLVWIGQPRIPVPNELLARKDTVIVDAGMVTQLLAHFRTPPGAVLAEGQRLRYVWHCHNLEHEDNDMMRPYDLTG
jgi:spore coat protein A, manganese oxidase